MVKVKVTVVRIMTGEPYSVFHKKFETLNQAKKYMAAMKPYGILTEIVQ